MDIAISGLSPAVCGDDWFLLDESGEFSLDTTVMANIWLVGGGMDGTDGFTDNKGFLHGGIGGQGGNIYKFGKIKLTKGAKYKITVAEANDISNTTFKIGQILFSAGQMGHTGFFGGAGGIVNPNGHIVNPIDGKDGIETPYGIVGSSGSGGVCGTYIDATPKFTATGSGGIGAGNSRKYVVEGIDWENIKEFNPDIDAKNYGCGGGGNTYCAGLKDIGVKSHGKKGCVIIQFTVVKNEPDNAPDCSIRYWETE